MGSNRIVLILIFIGIGYFLLYRDKPGPMSGMFDSLKNVFSTEATVKENPYKAKEKTSDSNEKPDLIDDISDKVADKTAEKVTGLFDSLKERLSGSKSEAITSSLPESYFPASTQKLEIVKHKAFVLGYSEPHEQAAWTFHELTKESTYGNASRDGLSFMPDSKISTFSALSTDYSRSGYDRGHLVPAGDFKCCQDLLMDTFWVSNIIPQNPDCNRNMWNSLEQQIRNWVRRKQRFYVFTGPVLEAGLPKIGKYNRISVPKYMFKILVIPNESNPENTQVQAFLIPNKPGLGYDFLSYRTTIDVIEQATGLDFLAPLPDEVENKLERNIATTRW